MYDGIYERIGEIYLLMEGVCRFYFLCVCMFKRINGGRQVSVCVFGCTT